PSRTLRVRSEGAVIRLRDGVASAMVSSSVQRLSAAGGRTQTTTLPTRTPTGRCSRPRPERPFGAGSFGEGVTMAEFTAAEVADVATIDFDRMRRQRRARLQAAMHSSGV